MSELHRGGTFKCWRWQRSINCGACSTKFGLQIQRFRHTFTQWEEETHANVVESRRWDWYGSICVSSSSIFQFLPFRASVVKHQTLFWVKSVRSNPIPPCRLQRFGISNYVPPLPTIPPPVKPFKMETHKVFDNEGLTPRVVRRGSKKFGRRSRLIHN